MNNKKRFGITVNDSYLCNMKHHEVLVSVVVLLMLAMLVGCKQKDASPSVELKDGRSMTFAALDSLADVNPDSADVLLKPTPVPSLKGRENEEVCKLLRIKTDDKLYRPITHYRDTILQLVDYFEHHRRVLPSLLGGTGPALPYLYAGRVFADLGDAPQALDYYQKALDALPKSEIEKGEWKTDNAADRSLAKQRGLILSQIGEQFYFQGLHDDALDSYRQANEWAKLANDTADILFNLRDIAEQYKFLEKVDSSLYLYQQALSLAKDYKWQKKCNELMSQISSLYIRKGDFKLANEYMRPSLENVDSVSLTSTYAIASKVYKHEGKVDSAIFCYHKLLEHGNLYGKSFAHKELAEIALRFHKNNEAYQHLLSFNQYEDSLRKRDNAEAVARMHAAYNYQKHAKEAQVLKVANAQKRFFLIISFISVIALLFALLWLNARYQERKKRIEQLNKKREELETKNARFVESLRKELDDVKLLIKDAGKDDDEALQMLFREKRRLDYTYSIANIQVRQSEDTMVNMMESPIYQMIQERITKKLFKLSSAEWQQVENVVNENFEGFIDRLSSFGTLSVDELHTSLLLKMRLSHKHIASFINKTPSGETNIRKRLYDKFFHTSDGTAAEWDSFIKDL